ncbi:MAG: flippase [Bacteroidetes bacterium]|nr:flippase [Bacteroidota bacterium]
MKENENLNIIYSSRSIAKNTIYNLFGYGIPLIFALLLIPFLIKGMGDERFGILNLAWEVIGYFSFFDFGIGRALTKIIAEKIGNNQTKEIPKIFWTSIFLMFSASLIFTILLLLLVPSLVYSIFNISETLQEEALTSFYLLALSIPIVTTTAGIRGLLEAYQKFDTVNIIRIILGVFTFLGPVICLIFSNSLIWIIVFLILVRIVVWVLYLSQCFKLNKTLKGNVRFSAEFIKPIFRLSGWMTISNIIVPLLIYSDRFLIGSLVSATAVTYYATPYEIVTKLLIIPSALTGVLFPAFSASYGKDPEFAKNLSVRAVKYIFLILYPIILVLITFAYEGLTLWVGEKFAINSSFILQLLAVGILFNGVAYISFSFLEGIGRPDITAKVQLAEFPIYIIVMWFAIKQNGIEGAAFIWMLRMIIDSFILFWFTKKQISTQFEFKFKSKYVFILILIATSIFPVFIAGTVLKIILFSLVIVIFVVVSWHFLLQKEEKIFLVSRIKALTSHTS